MAIRYEDENGEKRLFIGGHDPKLKLPKVGDAPADKGLRTKGPSAPDNRAASLEITNAALMARVERFKTEKTGLEVEVATLKAEVERLKTDLAKALLEVELQRTAVEVALSANKALLTRANDAVDAANKPANVLAGGANKPDRTAYQRELMRKRRAAEKAAKTDGNGT